MLSSLSHPFPLYIASPLDSWIVLFTHLPVMYIGALSSYPMHPLGGTSYLISRIPALDIAIVSASYPTSALVAGSVRAPLPHCTPTLTRSPMHAVAHTHIFPPTSSSIVSCISYPCLVVASSIYLNVLTEYLPDCMIIALDCLLAAPSCVR